MRSFRDSAPDLSRRALIRVLLAAPWACKADPPPPAHDTAAPAALPPPVPAPAPAPYVLPLFRAHPKLAAGLPRIALAQLPTPVERAAKLGRRVGLDGLHIKRDDRTSLVYGGGKARKLEFLLAAAKEAGAGAVITFGGVGSNHAVATALYAAQCGLRVLLHLAPQPGGASLRDHILAAQRAGAELHFVPGVAEAEAKALRRQARAAAGEAPFVIPAGGTSPLGNLSFVNAAFELAEQIAAGEMPAPDFLYVAMGTMGCAVGLAIGLAAAGLSTRLVAVRASSAQTSSEARFFAMAAETVAYARRLDPSFPDVRLGRGDVRIVADCLGAGYARPTTEGLRAIEMAREEEGWTLEPTYTGKALAALLRDARALGEAKKKIVLFWNTHHAHPLVTDGADPRRLPAGFGPYLTAK